MIEPKAQQEKRVEKPLRICAFLHMEGAMEITAKASFMHIDLSSSREGVFLMITLSPAFLPCTFCLWERGNSRPFFPLLFTIPKMQILSFQSFEVQ
jgi:hypothetical protein